VKNADHVDGFAHDAIDDEMRAAAQLVVAGPDIRERVALASTRCEIGA
jgi:hypothetical protein